MRLGGLVAHVLNEHQLVLIRRKRCVWCAERMPPGRVLRGETCAVCDRSAGIEDQADEVFRSVSLTWRRWRIPFYIFVALSVGAAGFVPILGSIVFAGAMVLANVTIIRGGLRWLGIARRIFTRLTLNLGLASLTMLNLIAGVLLVTVPIAGQFGSAGLSILFAVAYLELSVAWTSNRIRLEARQGKLQPVEWMVPAGILSVLGVLALGSSLLIGGLFYLIAVAEIPGASDIAAFLIDMDQQP